MFEGFLARVILQLPGVDIKNGLLHLDITRVEYMAECNGGAADKQKMEGYDSLKAHLGVQFGGFVGAARRIIEHDNPKARLKHDFLWSGHWKRSFLRPKNIGPGTFLWRNSHFWPTIHSNMHI